MRWRGRMISLLGFGLALGCELIVPFETIPEGAGGSATTSASSGASSGASSSTSDTGPGGTTTSDMPPCAMECCSDLDCATSADLCQVVSCQAGKCVAETIVTGDAPTQIPGDCKRVSCEGGIATSVNDATDTFDDGNDCTNDECNNGLPNTNETGGGSPCVFELGAGICNGKGKCVQCTSNAHCPIEKPKCNTNYFLCIPSTCDNNDLDPGESDQDCGGDCPPCDTGQSCMVSSDCASNACGAETKACLAPTCSDGIKNGDEGDVDCGNNCAARCAAGQGCDNDNDCISGRCTGPSGVCIATCNDDQKNNFESDVDCGGPECNDCNAGAQCSGVDANCLSADCGPAGTCEKGQNGTPCGGASQNCVSGFCANGVCCDSNCNGVCKSCNLAGAAGKCSNLPAGQSTAGCLAPLACDGNGNCQ